MLRVGDNGLMQKLAALLCFISAITLQIQATLFASDAYLGLRVNLTDLLLPFAGAVIFFMLLKNTTLSPRRSFLAFIPWVCIITALLSFALINSYFSFDEISRWALLNKFIGWFVLLAILGLGGWIGTNLDEKNILSFLRIFIGFFMGLMIFQIIVLSAQAYGWLEFNRLARFPIAGLMANRNAYGLLTLCTLCLTTCFYFYRPSVFFKLSAFIFYFSLPMFVLFCGSRATFIALCVLLLIFAVAFHKNGKQYIHLILILIAGVVFTFGAFHDKQQALRAIERAPYEVLLKANQASKFGPLTLSGIGEDVGYPGDSMRLTILQDAIEMIQMRPLVGSGLGGMMAYQKQKHGKVINIIDCTPLWILVEMGVIGLLLFAAFYFKIAASLFQSWQASEDFSKTFRLSLLFILLAFTIMSLFHEIMYTRFIWFFLGIGLALPLKMHPPAQSV